MLLACSEAELPPDRGESPLLLAFERAAEQSGVPLDLLLAIAYSESRFSLAQGPSRLGGHGLMHLREGTTLRRAAALSGFSEERLRREPSANILGAALVLAELAGPRPGRLLDWAPALARYSGLGPDGERHAAALLELLARGFQGSDDRGRSLRVPPRPELGSQLELLAPGLGRWQSALTPDYPEAEWQGPACSSSSRSGTAINMVVIHTCQGGFSGCVSWLKGCNDVSAHYVLSSTGKIVQLVEEKLKAWHAGCVNARSVGLEHEGYVENPGKWYTEAMYCASARLVKSICTRNGFPCDRQHVLGHDDVNQQYCSGTHTDPGSGWDWTRFMGYVQNGCGGAPPPPSLPQLTITATIGDLPAQPRDLCTLGTSQGVFDWWSDQETEASIDLKNGGGAVAREVEVGILGAEPHLMVARWEIWSDASGSFQVNDTDAMQKIPRQNPGGSFRLWLGAFAVGETKRIKLRVRSGAGSLGGDHAELRAFVARIEGVYQKASYQEAPSQNLDGSQIQNGGDLRAAVPTDVLAEETCGDGRDNDCSGTIDDGCTSPPGPGPEPPPPPSPPGGCSCQLVEHGAGDGGALLLLLALLALLIGRRPRRASF